MKRYEAAAHNRRLAHDGMADHWPAAGRAYRAVDRDVFHIADVGVAAFDALGGMTHAQRYAVRDMLHALVAALKLVDHVLDGEYEARPPDPGMAANLALVGPVRALALISGDTLVSADTRRRVVIATERMLLDFCAAQEGAAGTPRDEESYWTLVSRTTGRLLRYALWLGAILAGRTVEEQAFTRLAEAVAGILQISDDLTDAIRGEEATDWSRRTLNLAILYAEEVDHPGRAEFNRLIARYPDGPDLLDRLRELLFESDAIGFCVFAMLRLHREAIVAARALDGADSAPLLRLTEELMAPCFALMRSVHLDEADASAVLSDLAPELLGTPADGIAGALTSSRDPA